MASSDPVASPRATKRCLPIQPELDPSLGGVYHAISFLPDEEIEGGGMDQDQDARLLLDRIDVLRHPSDLDLLIFFARHPRSLLASEQLAAFLGYGVKAIAASLELLLGAALITRTPSRSHAARLYVFSVDASTDEWLPALLKIASTREGRLAMIWELRRRASQAIGDSHSAATPDAAVEPGPRPFLVRNAAGHHGER